LSVRLRARKSVRKIAAYCQSARIAFQTRADIKKIARNMVFAQKIHGGMTPPDLVISMSGRSETTSITTQATKVRVLFEADPMFNL